VDLQELSDRAEINDVLHRYTTAVDTFEWDRLDAVFTPDAQVDYTETGGTSGSYPEVKAWLAESLPAFTKRCMHSLAQVVITFANTRDEARVTAYFHNPMVIPDGQEGERLVEVGGIYHHTMVRTDAGWRSRRLHEQLVWTRGF
jgi:hypothetical protein